MLSKTLGGLGLAALACVAACSYSPEPVDTEAKYDAYMQDVEDKYGPVNFEAQDELKECGLVRRIRSRQPIRTFVRRVILCRPLLRPSPQPIQPSPVPYQPRPVPVQPQPDLDGSQPQPLPLPSPQPSPKPSPSPGPISPPSPTPNLPDLF